jgi:hypothetical protein
MRGRETPLPVVAPKELVAMNPWVALYEQPMPLTAQLGHHRIFAPPAYRRPRELTLVPIVHTEAFELARAFPTCWAMTDEGPVLMVLRALTDDSSGIPAPVRKASGMLPRALQAYPVVVPSAEDAFDSRIRFDCVIAEEPTDVGAPLMMADGKLSRATTLRARLAAGLGRILPATLGITRSLHEAGLLEPWPLRFDLGYGQSVDINHLMVLSRSRLDDPSLFRIISTYGADAAVFLAAHRLSLFKISGLLAAAKAVVARRNASRSPAVNAA